MPPSISHCSGFSTALNHSLWHHKEIAPLGGIAQPRNMHMNLTSVSNTTVQIQQYPDQFSALGNGTEIAVCTSKTVVPIANLPPPNSLTIVVWMTDDNKLPCLKKSSCMMVELLMCGKL